jgi:hypothetical protein
MAYFYNFPRTLYKFGNEESQTAFQDISAYVDIIDQIKDDINFYRFYTISDGDRPDTVSFKVYGTPFYYWSFFLLNDNLKIQGWPLSNAAAVEKAQKDFPNTTLTTRQDLTGIFLPGQVVSGSTSGATGTIIKRRLDFGQLIIEGTHDFVSGEIITSNVGDNIQTTTLSAVSEEYNSVHHYENSDGQYVDIDPAVGNAALFNEVTFLDRYIASNDELKTIKIIKPTSLNGIVSAYTEALRS